MTNRLLVSGLIFCALLAATDYSLSGGTPETAAASKGLRDAYAGAFLIGAAGDIPRGYSEAELANIKANYDIVTPENCMKPQPTHPSEDTYNFTTPDALVHWCRDNGIQVWGHTLAWHSQTAPWFFQAPASETEEATEPAAEEISRDGRGGSGQRGISGPPASRELAMERLKKHIMTVVGRYKGRIKGWDVFNESIADGGDGSTENLRNYSWYTAVGPDVLTMAFKWAHEADPEAQLYYNDYNIEQGAVEIKGKHASSLLLLKRLVAEGAPITGVGIQGHWHLDTNLADVEKAIENYAALGLRVAVTELDVTATGTNSGAFGVRGGGGTIPPENYQKQAEVYAGLFEIFKRHADVIDRVTFWGISDTRSWRRGQDALLFDGQLNPKPAYKAIMDIAPNREKNVMVSLTPPANVTRIKLYEKTPNVVQFPENELNPMEPTLDLYIPDADRATGAGVLLCPGGGYEMLTVPGEGGAIAEFFKAHNIAAFVLRYRHGPQYHYPTTLLDARRALRHIKAHAEEYNVDPDRVGVFGGSAGGHLAAMLATLYGRRLMPEGPYVPDEIDSLSARPAFALLLYPVIDLTDNSVTHKGSRTNLTQDNPDLYEALSPWKHVTGDTPPAFIVHGTNDFLVAVKNSLLYYEACLKARIPVEMHLLDTPMHGFGMGADLKDETLKDWPEQAVRFVERHTGTK